MLWARASPGLTILVCLTLSVLAFPADYHREPVGHLAFDSDGNDFPARACQLSAPWPLIGNGYQFEVRVSTEACRSRLDRGIGAACVTRTRDPRITKKGVHNILFYINELSAS